ncbi:MAG TPA: 2-oxoglutarate dehydrogenase E1 component [Chthoniobacteraceae bacterium]|jgi:2-oxoglutarate dehydrogenase E1 component|nr:2-oxoglutarate dehydrogenase E1 component [Chthoniobacteraceae bacterium]
MAISFATKSNVDLLDQNYEQWRKDPASVDPTWAAFYEGFEFGSSRGNGANGATAAAPAAQQGEVPLQTRVDGLVYGYRTLGHTIANLDPLAKVRPENPLLSLRELGFTEKDLDLQVSSRFLNGGERMALRDMIATLEKAYCGPIGAEFVHIQNPRVRNWVRERIEARVQQAPLPAETQRRMLEQILNVESFEHFLHTRYVGQKRFSIEGGESLIAALYGLLEKCPAQHVDEICMGMAHRGRLSVINEFLQKSLTVMFAEFSENFAPNSVAGDGDVKYHLGYKTTRELPGGHKVEIRLAANPSHLEAVNPVVEGMARARQRVLKDMDQRAKVLPVLIHGDAAFAGQGIVAETLNMSQLPGYRTGGTVHLVVNNQIGFTTSPADARSSRYCTDVAKMIEAPVLHVNGDNPLAVRFCAELAFEFRQTFKSDIVIDIYCYRRYGHNETDEPLFTQPLMYANIGHHPSVGTTFRRELVGSGVLTLDEATALTKQAEERYEAAFTEVRAAEANKSLNKFADANTVFQPPYVHDPVETAIGTETLNLLCDKLTTLPENFHAQGRLKKFFLDKRVAVWKAGGPFDWSYAEALAFGSLLAEKIPVRLSGQDCRRGTFSQRHCVLYDEQTRNRYIPLQHLTDDQARFCVYNSLLSENAVLGFDYGYSLSFPQMLTLWEAQFGDFSNGAQVVIDQFIASAESKWQRPSGIVLLLPHGYEGQGPEHSSGRLERFLQLCAEDNIQVANVTTPAQYFHLLRRQMKRAFKKPLVLMTPKSLLRAAECVSTADDFTKERFHEIYPGPAPAKPKDVSRIILCTGKVYYDLLKYREEKGVTDAAIIRVEQLYPLHEKALLAAFAEYPKAKSFVWCQEESANMGAWSYLQPNLRRLLGDKKVAYAGRNASASPAVGSLGIHKQEQKVLIEEAFTLG